MVQRTGTGMYIPTPCPTTGRRCHYLLDVISPIAYHSSRKAIKVPDLPGACCSNPLASCLSALRLPTCGPSLQVYCGLQSSRDLRLRARHHLCHLGTRFLYSFILLMKAAFGILLLSRELQPSRW